MYFEDTELVSVCSSGRSTRFFQLEIPTLVYCLIFYCVPSDDDVFYMSEKDHFESEEILIEIISTNENIGSIRATIVSVVCNWAE